MNASEAIRKRDGVICLNASSVRIPKDASPAGGTSVKPGDYVRFEVSDAAVGMEPGVQVQMFDPLFTRGTALGSIDKILREHGAKISVVSALGRGTTFHARFPAVEKLGDNTTAWLPHRKR